MRYVAQMLLVVLIILFAAQVVAVLADLAERL
jgi:archaellum component FlaG (FlaF/FlaG flagellin family)